MFEQEVKAHLQARTIPFDDGTASKTTVDFHLPRYRIFFDAKEKTQPFSLKNWKESTTTEEHLFIIDDLAARKLLFHAPLAFCLIKNSSMSPPMFHIFSVVDLLCVPKKRVRRPIEKSVKTFKGKWLLDLRDAAVFDQLGDAIAYMLTYEKNFSYIFKEHIDCWGKYPSEQIKTAGSTRKPIHWRKDAEVHR
jgi:hypothetical protein